MFFFDIESSPFVGSSKIMTFEEPMNAEAIESFRKLPPDK
jgi:hypothetical protein